MLDPQSQGRGLGSAIIKKGPDTFLCKKGGVEKAGSDTFSR